MSSNNGLRVLVIEDDVDTAESVALLLGMEGHEVDVAGDGPSALCAAQSRQPDVALLDIGLPGAMDGYQVARRLHELASDKKPLLIAVTGFAQDVDRRRAAEAGIDLHLPKPADPEELLRVLRRFRTIVLPNPD